MILKYVCLVVVGLALIGKVSAQKPMSPEVLLTLNRVGAVGIAKDQKSVIYAVTKKDLETNGSTTSYYTVLINGGEAEDIKSIEGLVKTKNTSPDGKYSITVKNAKLQKVTGQDYYEDVEKSDVKIYDDLNYRHWDNWEDGEYSHIWLKELNKTEDGIDIMEGEPYDCPQMPFGGEEDYVWSPDSKKILYVAKKKRGKDYATSTNTDIYEYDLTTKKTQNLTVSNKGYDTSPAFSKKGTLAWLQMRRDGYESDKNDIIVRVGEKDLNLTKNWDGTVNSFLWDENDRNIYFLAPIQGTVQLFRVGIDGKSVPVQLTQGQFDIRYIVGIVGKKMIVARQDMNHATELYTVDLKRGEMEQLTHANDEIYKGIAMSKIEKRMVKTTDGKDMLTWVIYPPDFDPKKKYPTLLYCQGGPQGALSQFYSYRWNFQIMAAQGYIIVAPNRRGMPGHGVQWNEQISKDYGGQNMKDYLSAIDALAKEPYVDNERLGCIGASYGGYSCFYLAGQHEGRFKTFIAHDGIFNWRSMYGTTEELFFVNWDLGGAYWDKKNEAAQKSFNEFNPINFVDKWDSPIMVIQGGKDYRVPIGQGLEAFQAAQLKGLKSRLLYFPEENHWVLSTQNALVWQREFFRWLKETL